MPRDRAIGGRRSRRGGRAFALALALSLAVHAVLLVLIVRGLARAPRGGRGEVIPIEIVEGPPPRPPTAPAPAVPPPGAAASRPGARAERGRPAGRSAGEAAAAPPPGPERPRGTPSAGEVGGWFASRGLGGERAPPSLSVPPPRGVGGAGGGDAIAEEGARVRRRVGDAIASSRAADVSRYPDAHWTDLRDRMADGFSPGMDLLKSAARPERPSWLSAWSGPARRYAATGKPFGGRAPESRVASTSRENSARGGLDEGIAAFFEAGRLMGGGREVLGRMVTIVAVDQDASGVVTGVAIVRSSGNAAYDRMALGRADRMCGARGVDLPHVGRTEWAFTSEVVAPPSGPPLGFSFDANFKPAHGPSGPEVRTRIELVAIREG